jgi:hypothetical protein
MTYQLILLYYVSDPLYLIEEYCLFYCPAVHVGRPERCTAGAEKPGPGTAHLLGGCNPSD